MLKKASEDVSKKLKKSPLDSALDFKFPITCIIMAAGVSRRFQEQVAGNKLLVEFKGKPLFQWSLECFAQLDCHARIVVAREDDVGHMVPENSFQIVWNNGENLSPSVTIKKALLNVPKDSIGCLFAVGDQPFLTFSSIRRLCETFLANPNKIVALSWNQERGNPVLFPRSLFSELLTLEDGFTGRFVLDCHPELLLLVEANSPDELMDIDTRQQYTDACNGTPRF